MTFKDLTTYFHSISKNYFIIIISQITRVRLRRTPAILSLILHKLLKALKALKAAKEGFSALKITVRSLLYFLLDFLLVSFSLAFWFFWKIQNNVKVIDCACLLPIQLISFVCR